MAPAWGEAAVAATDHTRRTFGALTLAACALPGVMPAAALAEEAPEHSLVAVKMSGYQDKQPGLDRLSVKSPSFYLLTPLGRQWAVEGSLTHDDVSGASPRYYTDVSGASRMHDDRVAGDVRLTRYFERQSLSIGLSHSGEHDYVSNALSITGTHASEDNNTTWNAGIGLSRDRINPVNELVVNERKRTVEWQVGVTHALSPLDLVQGTLTWSVGQGYFSDPYKLFDERPRERNSGVLLLRWNHWSPALAAAVRSSYRLYHDSFGVQAHTVELNVEKPLNAQWTLTPSLRYHTQRAADFYVDPVDDANVYPGPNGTPTYVSTDQRLSAFGAVGLGLKLAWQWSPAWGADMKLERYEQRADWRLGGQGSPGVDPLKALQWQIGLSHKF